MATRAAELREWFEANGLSVSAWAKARGFAPETVYALLAGRTRGRRGEAHAAAVALGLKALPRADLPAPPTNPRLSQAPQAQPSEGEISI